MSEEPEVIDFIVTAVAEHLGLSCDEVQRAVVLGLAGVPLTNTSRPYEAWEVYRFMNGCYHLAFNGERGARECAGNILTNVKEHKWSRFVEENPHMLARLYLRYKSNLPGTFSDGDKQVEYRPLYDESFTKGRILMD